MQNNMSITEQIKQMSHQELEELGKLVEQELTRRWKSYEENPEVFRNEITAWSDSRLERFIFMAEMEQEYGRHESPSKTLLIAKEEQERRNNQDEGK